MSQAKREKEMIFIRIVIMIVTNVSLNTPKNVDSGEAIQLITFQLWVPGLIVCTKLYTSCHYL